MCQHLEDLHNSVNQYFPHYCMMLQNHTRVKDSFKVQDRPMDFNVPEYETLFMWF